MSVILKVDEKVKSIIDKLPEGYSDDDFLEAFKKEYPKDYQKCWDCYLEEERKTKPGKPHPMQHPDKHIKNALKSYLSRKASKEQKTMKTNYLKCLLATLLAVAGFITAKAESFKIDGLYYNIISEEEKTVEVTYYYQDDDYYNSYDSDKLDSEGLTKYKGDQTIPEKVVYKGAAYTVAAIGSHAFDCCPYLTSLTIPASVISIDDYAFSDCLSLASVDLPSVTSIGEDTFSGCTSLASIDLPSVTSIGVNTFSGCTSLASIDMPSVTSIGLGAFRDCTSLVFVDIPLVTSIGSYAFKGCTNLKEINVDISNNNYASVDGVLYNKDVTELILCPTGKTSLEVPNTVIGIADEAFWGCTSLSSIDMPLVTSIGNYAFSDCTSLSSINIPSVTSMETYAFSDCTSLSSIDMPLVTSIGYSAFSGCTSLSSIDMPLVTSIGEDTFSGCTSLTSIDMPSVTSIGNYAFEGCTSLVLIDMPLVTSIGNYAFEGCTSLVLIDMPLVTSIGGYAFEDCTSLAFVDIPASVTSIGWHAFEGCTSLAFVDIPASVTSIGIDAFLGCGLTSVFCHWQEPLELEDDPFFSHAATLYVPAGTKSAYEAVYPWSEFGRIVEMYYSSIDEAKASAPTVTVIDGAIVIEGETDMAQPVEVYSTGGQCVHRGTGMRIEGLPHGVYVVRVGQGTAKVVL
ncbi:MAG TPA: leucine-rich repeat domain-containing protein [Candidatus Avibacteroides faecavium]|nr:leucine-rich repeat domain-containing protein [Candidatus Avibacteroides faecavium]